MSKSLVLFVSLVAVMVLLVILFGWVLKPNVGSGGVEVVVHYSIVGDPGTISKARELIKILQDDPLVAERITRNWSNENIVVLEVTVELVNNGHSLVYYVTCYGCGVACPNKSACTGLEPVVWDIREPAVTPPKIIAEEGAVFPAPIFCTLDLRFRALAPGSRVVNKFYYIVTVPFKGRIEAEATICPTMDDRNCTIITGSTTVEIPTSLLS